MQFESVSEFVAMGGHGLYVWLCYGVAVLVLLANLILPSIQRRVLLRDLSQRQRRESNQVNTDMQTNKVPDQSVRQSEVDHHAS